MLLTLTTVIVVAGVAYGAYWAMYGRYFENTDDAYVAGNVVQSRRWWPAPWSRSPPTTPSWSPPASR